MYKTNLILITLITLLALALSACQEKAEINEVTFTAADYSFAGPDSIPAGWTRITMVNKGAELHHVQLVKLPADKTTDDLMAALQGESAPDWLAFDGGPNAAAPGERTVSTVDLEAGNYVLLCVIPDEQGVPHVAHGMIKPLTVTETSVEADAPQADVTMELKEFTFELSDTLTAGEHTVRVVNEGAKPHEITLVQLAPGATVEDFMAAFAPDAPPGPPPGKPIGGVTVIDSGAEAYFTAELTSGNYALICFHPDEETGRSHAELGMMQEIAVP